MSSSFVARQAVQSLFRTILYHSLLHVPGRSYLWRPACTWRGHVARNTSQKQRYVYLHSARRIMVRRRPYSAIQSVRVKGNIIGRVNEGLQELYLGNQRAICRSRSAGVLHSSVLLESCSCVLYHGLGMLRITYLDPPQINEMSTSYLPGSESTPCRSSGEGTH
jgi:hypothetical protein